MCTTQVGLAQCKTCGGDIRVPRNAQGAGAVGEGAVSEGAAGEGAVMQLSQSSIGSIDSVFISPVRAPPARNITTHSRGDSGTDTQNTSHSGALQTQHSSKTPKSGSTGRVSVNVEKVEGYLYMLYSPNSPYVKLGSTTNTIKHLLSQYRRFESTRMYYKCAVKNVTHAEMLVYEKNLFSELASLGYKPCHTRPQVTGSLII
jgi:hypothetical protein